MEQAFPRRTVARMQQGTPDGSSLDAHIAVSDVMNPAVLTCPPDAPLALVAHLMATHRVHRVVVEGTSGRRAWAVVSDLDLVSADATEAAGVTAGTCACTEFPTVGPGESLACAVRLMIEHEDSHVIVVDPVADRAVGVLSTLDVAGAIALARAGRT